MLQTAKWYRNDLVTVSKDAEREGSKLLISLIHKMYNQGECKSSQPVFQPDVPILPACLDPENYRHQHRLA